MALQRIYGQIIYWDSSVGDVLPNTNIAIGTKAVNLGDSYDKSEWDGTTWLDGWSYNSTEFIDVANGTASAYKPIKLNSMGQIDPSMLDTSSFYPVGTHDPSAGVEYPDETGETHGAFWMVEELTAPTDTDPEPHYLFTAGDLAGKRIRLGDFMVWGSAGWSIMAGEMNPTLYYKLDGSNHLEGNMVADNYKITMIADGTEDQDAVNLGQLNLKADISYVNSENAAQDTIIAGKADISYVDAELALKADITYVDSENAAQDSIIAGKVSKAGDTMTGNLLVGTSEPYGTVGVSNGGDPLTGKSSFILRDHNDNPRGTFYSNNAGYVGFQRQATDQSVAAEFALMDDGNIRSQIAITPVDDMDLIPLKFAEDTYVNEAGDTMTGDLTGPNFIITGSSPSHNIPSIGSVIGLSFNPDDGVLTLSQDSGDDVFSNTFDGRYELDLGDPDINGKVLSSLADGTRSWVSVDVIFTNAEPTPVEHGGIPAGSTFDAVPVTQMWQDVLYPYQAPSFDAFDIADVASAIEVGASITAGQHEFTWSTVNPDNIVDNSIAISDPSGDLGSGLADDGSEDLEILTGISMDTPGSHTFTITAENSNAVDFTRTSVVSWQWRNFYGNDQDGDITAADILAGDSRLDTSGNGDYTPPIEAKSFKWLAYPAEYGEADKIMDPSTSLDVAMDPAWNPATVAITNANGVSVDMFVYRTINELNGSLTMRVSGALRGVPRAPIPGVIGLTGKIAPADDADQYPVTDEQYNYGGYRTVATLVDRDAIFPLVRKAGMLVYVLENSTRYKLEDDLNTWTEDGGVPTGGATWDVLRKSSGTNFATEWAESPGAFIIDTTWADLVAAQVAGNVKQWDKYKITDQANLLIEIKLQDPNGGSWFEVVNTEGTITLKEVI